MKNDEEMIEFAIKMLKQLDVEDIEEVSIQDTKYDEDDSILSIEIEYKNKKTDSKEPQVGINISQPISRPVSIGSVANEIAREMSKSSTMNSLI